MLVALIILALLQPVSFWLGAWVVYRVRTNQSPALSFPRKVEVVGDADGKDEPLQAAYTKGRPIL